MAIKLVCVLPFHGYAKGQEVTDPHLVDALIEARDAHFVKVSAPDVAPPEPVELAPAAEHAGE